MVMEMATNTTQPTEAARRAADQHGLNPDNFLNFLTNRFGHYSPQYAHEWADRINDGRAYRCADEKTRDALRDAGYRNR